MSVTVTVNWNGSELFLEGQAVGSGHEKNKITTHGAGITYELGQKVRSVDKFIINKKPPHAPTPYVVTSSVKQSGAPPQVPWNTTLEVKAPNVTDKTSWEYTLFATVEGGKRVRLDPLWEDDP